MKTQGHFAQQPGDLWMPKSIIVIEFTNESIEFLIWK